MTEAERAISEGGGDGTKRGPDFVSIPDARLNLPPPLKLEVEESAEAMSPRNMWQVYALGGFLVLRWVWARWKERKDQGKSPGEPPSS